MSTTCEVNVKWGKEKYTVTIDLTKPPSEFKAQLYSLTHVPVDKQKSKETNQTKQTLHTIHTHTHLSHFLFLNKQSLASKAVF